jgi:hypothetical protein
MFLFPICACLIMLHMSFMINRFQYSNLNFLNIYHGSFAKFGQLLILVLFTVCSVLEPTTR